MLLYKFEFLFYLWSCVFFVTKAAKILAIYPFFSKSHFIFNDGIVKSLHHAGHHITAIHSFPDQNRLENYTIIDTSAINKSKNVSYISIASLIRPYANSITMFTDMMNNQEKVCHHVLSLKEIQHFRRSKEKLFDLVLVDISLVMFNCYFLLAEEFNVPIIGMGPTRSWKQSEWSIGNPYHPATVPYEIGLFRGHRMSFVQRLDNIWDCIFDHIYHYFAIGYRINQLKNREFPNSSSKERKKMSLLFLNGDNILLPRPLLPNVIYVGGIHLEPVKAIPPELRNFMDEADRGVILFSLGSFIRSDQKSSEFLKPFVEAFSQLPQRVIWKSDEPFKNTPNNILQLPWLPQRDILAHKNVVAFVTHCGISSIYEAIDAGKPTIMMPIFFDQMSNAALLEELGFGIYIDFLNTTKNIFLEAVNSIVNDSRYRDKALEVSRIFKDRPMSVQETVVYWTEYVIKHDGAQHLQSTAAEMPLYQYLLLDVITFVTIAVAVIFWGLYYFFRCICTRLSVARVKKKVESPKKMD